MRYMLANLILAALPPTRLFGAKRMLLRLLGVLVGEDTRVCGGVRFYGGGRVQLGARTWIGLNCKFYTAEGADVVVGSDCDIAPETCFMTGSHLMGGHERRAGQGISGSILVGDGTWIGVRTTLLGGTRIGRGCMVSALGLVLPGDIAPDTLLVGSPAKPARSLA
jgi:maltose O-acetyltransferase